MDRRSFLTAVAATVAALATGCSAESSADVIDSAVAPTGTEPVVAVPDPPAPTPPPLDRVALPIGSLTGLPAGNRLALTVDDGTDPDVVGAYIEFARASAVRFTFFVTASYDSWTTHRSALRPLVDDGSIQLANHTWDHPDLTRLSSTEIAAQLTRTRRFLLDQYGVSGAPYYRPPYGFHDARVDAVAADLGYTTPTLWFGSLSDSSIITEDYLLQCARQYFTPGAVVIGHANHPAVTHVYPQLLDIIRSRALHTVTLDDVFLV